MKRVPLQRKTPLRQKGAQRRAPGRGQRKVPKPGFTDEAKATVRYRSGNRCEIRTEACTERATEFHHRKLRRFGDHRVVNCLHACDPCHNWAHDNPEVAYLMGWLVHGWDDPAGVPVRH